MNFTVLTLFPELFEPFWKTGIVRRAVERGLVFAETMDPRNFTQDRHRTADDRPYGGGCGMVMKPEPLRKAVRAARSMHPGSLVAMMTPQGRRFDRETARVLAQETGLILACGRYEGVDERFIGADTDIEISVGDFVLTGGELAAMIVMDAVTRLLPGALGDPDSAERDSFEDYRLGYAQYTRPPVYEDEAVPAVLLSGDHREIERWRKEEALIRTALKRPDLLEKRPPDEYERKILKKWLAGIERILQTQASPGADPLPGVE